MILTQVVLVDQTHGTDTTLLHSAALALSGQVTQDLTQYWSGIITAAVSVALRDAAITGEQRDRVLHPRPGA